MANIRGKEIDNTMLSIDQAETRGFIHRDYIAHCLRWTHVAKYLQKSGRYQSVKLLDIGCGKEVPLAKLMYSSRLNPTTGVYVGLDYNKLEYPDMFHTGKFPLHLVSQCVFPDTFAERKKAVSNVRCVELPDKYDVIVCFEVAEHVEPDGTKKLLEGIRDHLAPGGIAFMSTPCYDSSVGAAGNHVNEMSHDAFGAMIEYVGLTVENVYGTFASISDYKNHMGKEELVVFERMRAYYDTNYLATIFAPLFPKQSRNCIWELTYSEKGPSLKYPDIRDLRDGFHSSSRKWTHFVDALDKE